MAGNFWTGGVVRSPSEGRSTGKLETINSTSNYYSSKYVIGLHRTASNIHYSVNCQGKYLLINQLD